MLVAEFFMFWGQKSNDRLRFMIVTMAWWLVSFLSTSTSCCALSAISEGTTLPSPKCWVWCLVGSSNQSSKNVFPTRSCRKVQQCQLLTYVAPIPTKARVVDKKLKTCRNSRIKTDRRHNDRSTYPHIIYINTTRNIPSKWGTIVTCILVSSSLILEMMRRQPSVILENPALDKQTSLMILITRFRTLTPVSIIRSAIFSKYCKSSLSKKLVLWKMWRQKDLRILLALNNQNKQFSESVSIN